MRLPGGGQRAEVERDLYRKCLELVHVEDPDPLLEEALDLLLEVTRSAAGYLELRDPSSDDRRSWSADFGVDDTERANIERRISRGVIAEAIETGAVVHTASALLDARFAHRESVQREALDAVLCVPFSARGAAGVVYLQDRDAGGTYSDTDIACVEAIAQFLGALSGRLLEVLRRRREQDHTSRVRDRLQLDGLIGRSAALATVLERLEVLARMEANVLLSGPSGSGKSLFARLLHRNSSRANAPFIALNCAALPETLVESELFGAEKGAHSTADQAASGKVAAAEGGTLFLDEVGELPLAVQAKVLQLVQNKEYYRLGGTRPITANVRIITATNRDLEEEIRNRTFRDDLYYRIRGLQLRIPPLAQRKEDIPLLIAHYCAESCLRVGAPDLVPSAATLSAAEFFEWPGNVRELASACEEAVINAQLDGSMEIEPKHLFPTSDAPQAETFQEARQQWERSYLDKVLRQQEWNVAKTARVQGMSRSHLNALIRRFELRREPKTDSSDSP